jgi:glycolate oxidase iron-sulfur subunit
MSLNRLTEAWVSGRFRVALIGASLARPFARLVPGRSLTAERLRAMLRLAPARVPGPSAMERPGVFRAEGERRGRVALLTGCAQQVLAPSINEATIRLFTRLGYDVVVRREQGCCGALTHHMGMKDAAMRAARANIAGWHQEIAGEGLAAILINASGCGTTVKDYGHMFRAAPEAAEAAAVSAIAMDVTEALSRFGYAPTRAAPGLTVAYHAACSLQHGQKVTDAPKRLLTNAGYRVRTPAEAHLCCGSAGTYNILQSEIASELGTRKAAHLDALEADVIATGNVGCATQIARFSGVPVVHTVELLDWATGGPKPAALG